MFYFVSVTAISHVRSHFTHSRSVYRQISWAYFAKLLQHKVNGGGVGVLWGWGVGIRMIQFTQIHFTQFHSTQRKQFCIRFDNILSYLRDNYPTWADNQFTWRLNYLQVRYTLHYNDARKKDAFLTHWGRDKWLPISRRHFQMHFLQWKCMNYN